MTSHLISHQGRLGTRLSWSFVILSLALKGLYQNHFCGKRLHLHGEFSEEVLVPAILFIDDTLELAGTLLCYCSSATYIGKV